MIAKFLGLHLMNIASVFHSKGGLCVHYLDHVLDLIVTKAFFSLGQLTMCLICFYFLSIFLPAYCECMHFSERCLKVFGFHGY